MRTRSFGDGTLELSELCLGTWGLSGDGYGPVPEQEQEQVIERALLLGIRTFETADVYGGGAMEQRLGRQLPKDALIITKLGTRLDPPPARKDFSRAFLQRAFEASVERLGREPSCVMLHNPSPKAIANGEALDFLRELKERGRIATWGVSSGSVDAQRAALGADTPLLSVAYNLYHYQHLDALAHDLAERRIGVLVHSVLSHGLLAGVWPANKQFPPGDHRAERWTKDGLRRRLRQLVAVRPAIADDTPSLRAVALRFALHNEAVTSVIIGPRTALQLDQLVREAGKAPPYLDQWTLDGLRDRLSAAGAAT